MLSCDYTVRAKKYLLLLCGMCGIDFQIRLPSNLIYVLNR